MKNYYPNQQNSNIDSWNSNTSQASYYNQMNQQTTNNFQYMNYYNPTLMQSYNHVDSNFQNSNNQIQTQTHANKKKLHGISNQNNSMIIPNQYAGYNNFPDKNSTLILKKGNFQEILQQNHLNSINHTHQQNKIDVQIPAQSPSKSKKSQMPENNTNALAKSKRKNSKRKIIQRLSKKDKANSIRNPPKLITQTFGKGEKIQKSNNQYDLQNHAKINNFDKNNFYEKRIDELIMNRINQNPDQVQKSIHHSQKSTSNKQTFVSNIQDPPTNKKTNSTNMHKEANSAFSIRSENTNFKKNESKQQSNCNITPNNFIRPIQQREILNQNSQLSLNLGENVNGIHQQMPQQFNTLSNDKPYNFQNTMTNQSYNGTNTYQNEEITAFSSQQQNLGSVAYDLKDKDSPNQKRQDLNYEKSNSKFKDSDEIEEEIERIMTIKGGKHHITKLDFTKNQRLQIDTGFIESRIEQLMMNRVQQHINPQNPIQNQSYIYYDPRIPLYAINTPMQIPKQFLENNENIYLQNGAYTLNKIPESNSKNPSTEPNYEKHDNEHFNKDPPTLTQNSCKPTVIQTQSPQYEFPYSIEPNNKLEDSNVNTIIKKMNITKQPNAIIKQKRGEKLIISETNNVLNASKKINDHTSEEDKSHEMAIINEKNYHDKNDKSITIYDEDELKVWGIFDERIKNGSKQYLVQWEGYSDQENTWENETDLIPEYSDIINQYKSKGQKTQSIKPISEFLFCFLDKQTMYYSVKFQDKTHGILTGLQARSTPYRHNLIEFLSKRINFNEKKSGSS